MELHLDELIYLIYTINRNRFMETDETYNNPTKHLQSIEFDPNNKLQIVEFANKDEDKDNSEKDDIIEETIENFRNIPEYNFYYY